MERDQFAKLLGIRLLEVREGYARACMEILDHHRNGVGIAHGGAIFSLADLAFGAAANSHGTVALAIQADIAFTRPGTTGVLTAEAREISRSSKLATYAVSISDEEGGVIASFQGIVYRKKNKLPMPEET